MTKPIITIYNAETSEIINREMNASEFAQHKADQKDNEARLVEEEAKAQAKIDLLAKLGITAEEAQLLLS